MLPGPMPIYVSKKDTRPSLASILGILMCSGAEPPWPIPVTLPRRMYRAIREALKKQTPFLTEMFIIGPVIAPNITERDLRRLARTWMDYGFDFLTPVADGTGRLSNELDQLRPGTEFERQIVEC